MVSNVPRKRVASSAFGNKWLLFQSYRGKFLKGKQGEAQLILLFFNRNPSSEAEQHLAQASSHFSNTLVIKSRTILALSSGRKCPLTLCFTSKMQASKPEVRNAPFTWIKTNEWQNKP